jgi:alanyl-tRNA synthetase
MPNVLKTLHLDTPGVSRRARLNPKDDLRLRFSKDYDKYYRVSLFEEEGYKRKVCPNCRRHFWSLKPAAKLCPDCEGYSFIGSPPTNLKLDYTSAWSTIEDFFTRRGHTSVKRYPVVARWRPDLYFTVASIIDFQRVEEGRVVFDFPANPLIVPQFSLRFNDIENVGVTGRHYSSFCMVGQHALANEEGYWKDRTIELDFSLLKDAFKVPREEITFVEDVWLGYGAFGYSLEYFVKGLEIGNAVFTEFEGSPDEYKVMTTPVVDMGAGLERFTWMTQGTPTSYEAVFGPIYHKVLRRLGMSPDAELMCRYYSRAGALDVTEALDPVAAKKALAKDLDLSDDVLSTQIAPLEALFSVLDHTRTLLFAIVDGALPSNVAGGYNLRVLFRRARSFIDRFGWNISLLELAALHAEYLKPMYPELVEGLDVVEEIFDVEDGRYSTSKSRVSSIVQQLRKSNKTLTLEDLIRLYDSEGVTPELLRESGLSISVPPDFYLKVTEKHVGQKQVVEAFEHDVTGLPKTKALYYEDRSMFDFEAKVIKTFDGGFVVLDQTAFYPRSGGQEPDHGSIEGIPVVDVVKYGDVIVHKLDGRVPPEGSSVRGKVDAVRRGILMRHHTATHIVNGAARQVLGPWVWQHSAYKDVDKARLDITHHSHLTRQEMLEIERVANQVVQENIPVELQVLPRNVAEKKYGFRLYQGGITPAKELRIQRIDDFDVEACGGTHCSHTGEVGYIKLLKAERLQDGVERLEFVAGMPAVRHMAEQESRVMKVAEELQTQPELIPQVVGSLKRSEDALKKKYRNMAKELASQLAEALDAKAIRIDGVKLLVLNDDFYDEVAHLTIGELLSQRRPEAVYVGIMVSGEKCSLVCFVGDGAQASGVDASALIKRASAAIGGSGGGTRRMAQGGGNTPRSAGILKDLITAYIKGTVEK